MLDLQTTGPVRNIAALRLEMSRRGLDAFILPRFDAHQGEYVAPHDARLAHVTGFTGSAGLAIVTADIVAIFVDGRYSVQLLNQCPGPQFLHRHLFDDPPEDWLARTAEPGWQVGFDPMHIPPVWQDRFADGCARVGGCLIALNSNPVDAVWADQPAPPMGEISSFPAQLAGKTASDKIADLAAVLVDAGADFFVETQPDNIAWLLNVRGDDVPFNPIPHSFLLIDQQGRVDWFVARPKLPADVQGGLPNSVRVDEPDRFLTTLTERAGKGDTVLIDPEFSPSAVRIALRNAGVRVVEKPGHLTLTKAKKNAVELEGIRTCHIQDGVAWTEFLAWLDQNVQAQAANGTPICERDAENRILLLRQARTGFICESFNSISAAGGNAAMCHYATTKDRNAPILPDRPYLLDSGGQYDTGTTDATRSVSFGTRPEGYDQAYTAVFKALYALATLRFPPGTQGHHIDAICRRPLWDLGLDFDHGTGHGIGHRLSVHEHPQRIGKPYNPVDLVPGMVLSIEPGYYKADRFGIRLENLYEIVQAGDGFFEFRTLTFVPIHTAALRLTDLTKPEIAWLNAYHQEVLARLNPLLSPVTSDWAKQASRPV